MISLTEHRDRDASLLIEPIGCVDKGLKVEFGEFEFGLDETQEQRARRLHQDSIIIDTLFQGPCGYHSFTQEMVDELKTEFARNPSDPQKALWSAVQQPVRRAIRGEFPQFKQVWEKSGITGGNRQVGGDGPGGDVHTFALNQAQFDNLPWLSKATSSEDFRSAKRNGTRVGFVSTQNTLQFGRDLDHIDRSWELGMRMIQLTYNNVNFVGGGCTDRADCGVTDFGVEFIERMNKLGIIVDVGHCGKQTTLDACDISSTPVVASHTAAQGVHQHDRGKSDEELRAIASSGGYIGVVAVPAFLTDDETPTIEHLLDHVDYIVQLVGTRHVGIGSDWPMQVPQWGVERLAEYALQIGFRPEHGVGAQVNLVGFDDYRDYQNVTRGLVKRGYTDEQIRGILGENFLRVFEDVCG